MLRQLYLSTLIMFFLGSSSVFFYASSLTFADSSPKVWISNDGGFKRDYLTDGKVKVPTGFLGLFDLSEILKEDPVAMGLYEKQSQYDSYAKLSYWIGVFPSSVVFIYGVASNKVAATWISLGTLVASSILTGHYISEARHAMFAAINHYNGVGESSLQPLRVQAPAVNGSSPFYSGSNQDGKIIEVSFHF